MEYRVLGKTGVQVSKLCMGTMTFGTEADKRDSRQMFNLCRDAGINFFDCANKYGNGESEKILAECIRHCRHDLILTTKGGSRMAAGVNDLGASRRHLRLELEKSLQRLQTDYIDIYFIHYFDTFTDIEETMRFLDDAVRQGKVLYTGVSNWAAWQIMKALHISRSNLLQTITAIQPMYSLIKRQAEVEILPMAEDQSLGVVSYSPIGAGVLTGKYAEISADTPARLHDKDYYNKRYQDQNYFSIAARFTTLARELGYAPAPLAISWACHHPAITAAIIGARNSEQLKINLQAAEIDMVQELRERISALSPPPAPAHDRLEEQLDAGTRLHG